MPYYHNDDIINPNGVDFVEVDKLVNPPNASNAGKVVGIGEDGKAALIEPGGGETITLYVVDKPTTDPDLPPEAVNWDFVPGLEGGLSLTDGGDALTYAELGEIMDSGKTVMISAGIAESYPVTKTHGYIENVVFAAVFSVIVAGGEDGRTAVFNEFGVGFSHGNV